MSDQNETPPPEQKDHVSETDDLGKELLKGLVNELLNRLKSPARAAALSASEMELIRKLCADNSVSLSSIKRGDFGETAKRVAEEFPFPEGATVDMGGSA